MKLVIILIFTLIASFVTYHVSLWLLGNIKKFKNTKLIAKSVAVLVALGLIGMTAIAIVRGNNAPDMQCGKYHSTSSFPPATLKTAMDYFNQGNYDYDTGNCEKAITDYTTSIKLDPKYAQSYNNRAYTNMRLRNYKDALPDLDKAITLNPNYVQALNNRADIHNFYYEIDTKKALDDYMKVASIVGEDSSNVCGHIFLAKHGGWNLGTILDLPRMMMTCK